MNPNSPNTMPLRGGAEVAMRLDANDRLEPDFVDALLGALTEMAVLSPRRQADLAIAMRRAGMEGDEALLDVALEALEEDGCIEHVVRLGDGGVLVSVTAHGIERLSQTSRRYVLDI
jgi:hypothetical protein